MIKEIILRKDLIIQMKKLLKKQTQNIVGGTSHRSGLRNPNSYGWAILNIFKHR